VKIAQGQLLDETLSLVEGPFVLSGKAHDHIRAYGAIGDGLLDPQHQAPEVPDAVRASHGLKDLIRTALKGQVEVGA